MTALSKDTLINIIASVNKNITDFNSFIESGTNNGQTIINISENFDKQFYTIELSEYYYEISKKKFADKKNVHLFLGDSSVMLEKVINIQSIDDNCIFWLDGHWSGGNTAKGFKDCPLLEECVLIDNFYKANYGLILIDDFRLFGKKLNEDWSDITEITILNCFKNHKTFYFIDGDIMVIEIKK